MNALVVLLMPFGLYPSRVPSAPHSQLIPPISQPKRDLEPDAVEPISAFGGSRLKAPA